MGDEHLTNNGKIKMSKTHSFRNFVLLGIKRFESLWAATTRYYV